MAFLLFGNIMKIYDIETKLNLNTLRNEAHFRVVIPTEVLVDTRALSGEGNLEKYLGELLVIALQQQFGENFFKTL